MFHSDHPAEQEQLDAMLLEWEEEIRKNASKNHRQILGVNESFIHFPNCRENISEL